ncbi:protein amalgam-like [Saccostrea cucullata]|uniref:protein amalgam-like n=1 Tax=Saccostrea cuccullata TaxID=36930 RepID=UPI002ED4CBC9
MADNGVKAAVQHTIKVDVHFPPEVSLINDRQSQRVGRETILQCDVSASPLGVNVWKFGDREFDQQSGRNYRTEMYREDKMRVTLSLRILNIGEEDYGKYTCEAHNKYGRSERSMYLDVLMDPTQKPRSSSLTSTTQVLTYSDPAKRTHPETVSQVREQGNGDTKIFDFSKIGRQKGLRPRDDRNGQGIPQAVLWTEIIIISLARVCSMWRVT